MTKVELFESIRNEYFVHERSIRWIAGKLKTHRRTVRQAIQSAVPPPRKERSREPVVLTAEVQGIVEHWLEEDRRAPRKQRHTARRIYSRLVREHGFRGGESTVRRYVAKRKRELALGVRAAVPLEHLPGAEGEVDWYEAYAEFPEGVRRVDVFLMRACYSGREFHLALPRSTQQAFLEGHVEGFQYFGGIFRIVRYDNLSSAVKKILRGRRREETDRFIALRSHYLFQSEFCRPGKDGAAEKGGVEQAVGRFRRNHLVPVPKVADFQELNLLLLAACREDDARRIEGHVASIGEEWSQERAYLLPHPEEVFQSEEVSTHRVDEKSRARVRTNWYSVPVSLVGLRVEARVETSWVQFYHGGKLVAAHGRLYGRCEERLKLEHYAELLWYKPGALCRCRPLRQARDRGEWPVSYDELWGKLKERYGETGGTRQILEVLLCHREHPHKEVHQAVERALAYGCYDASAVRVLLRQAEAADTSALSSSLGAEDPLNRYRRPFSDTRLYDQLLGPETSLEEVGR